MRVSLKNIIAPTIPFAVLLVGFSFSLWGFPIFTDYRPAAGMEGLGILDKTTIPLFAGKFFPGLVCSISLNLLNAFLLAQINNRFAIIRTRTFLPILIFLLFVGSWTETHHLIGPHLALTFFILALFNYMSMLKNTRATEQAFMGSFFIGLTSVLVNPLILLVPACWLGLIIFQSFSLRTFLATLFGVATPWVFVFAAAYMLTGETEITRLVNTVFSVEFGVYPFSIPQLVYSGLLFVILVIGIVGISSGSNKDAIQTRNKLNFIILLVFSVLAISVFSKNHFLSLLPVIALLYSLIVSHPFSLKNNNFYGIVFIVFTVLNIAYVVANYFFF
ncbi:MAG TPA: hypothetical protein VK152_12580 [Paludibacter sp.]|nr:hypothetical protein [Paludibacter sp.]